METTKSLLTLLTEGTPVTLVPNDKLEGNPLITPTLDKTGKPKTDLSGNELGSIRLEQTATTFNNGFMNARKKVAFVTGTIEQLANLIKLHGLKAGSQIAGKIVQIESLVPMWKGQEPKMNPNTAEVVEIDVAGKKYPVYMQQRYTENASATDRLIRNADDVNEWIANQRALESLTAAPAETANVPA
jgi:hypothetical protein